MIPNLNYLVKLTIPSSYWLLKEFLNHQFIVSSSSYGLRRSDRRRFLFRHNRKLASLIFVHRHLSYLSGPRALFAECATKFYWDMSSLLILVEEMTWSLIHKWQIGYQVHLSTVTYELKLALSDRLTEKRFASKLVQALVRRVVYRLFKAQHDTVAFYRIDV